jgi:FKBP-type peptidyl-prolyl cis-trans isomerase FkpA
MADPGLSSGRRGVRVRLCLLAGAAFAAAAARAEPAAEAPPPARVPIGAPAPAGFSSFPLSTFNAIGSSFAEGSHLPELGWSDAQVAAFVEGMRSAFQGKPYPMDDTARQARAEIGRRLQEITAQNPGHPLAPPGQVKHYVQEMAKRLGLDETDSGLCYSISTLGKGSRPGPDDTVVLSCAALAADGQTPLPELSSARFRVRVAELLPGLREGIQMMAVGGNGVFLLPPALSFGNGEWPKSVASGSPLLFQVTLHAVVSPEAGK